MVKLFAEDRKFSHETLLAPWSLIRFMLKPIKKLLISRKNSDELKISQKQENTDRMTNFILKCIIVYQCVLVFNNLCYFSRHNFSKIG